MKRKSRTLVQQLSHRAEHATGTRNRPVAIQAAGRAGAAPPAKGAGDEPGRAVDFVAQAQFELEAAAGDGAVGAARFKMTAYTGGPMRVAAFYHPIVVDLAGIKVPSQKRPVRLQHDPMHGVGHTESVSVENGRLVASGVISRDTEAAREVTAAAKKGFPWQASVGLSADEYEFVKPGQKTRVNGREYAGPMYVVHKSTLGEISFVDSGADGNTSVKVAANEPAGSTPEPTGAQAGAGAASPAPAAPSQQPAAPATDVVASMRAEAAAEAARISAVRTACAGAHPAIEAKAIAEGWSADKTELEILRAERARAPRPNGQGERPTARVLEAALALSTGLEKPEDHFEAQTLEAADRRFRGGLGLNELLVEAARANGYTGTSSRDLREILRFAFGHGRGVEASGFSTIDIGGILSNISNKFLLAGFFGVERTWRNICGVRNVRDFKTVTSYRLIGTDQYERVAPGGQIKHGTLGEESYTNKADTYGLMLQIDRRDIVNDDLGAISTVPRKLGRGAGLKINDVFWTEFLDHASFFASGNNNYIEGAATALGIDGLTAGELKFLDQVDADGKPIGVNPAILLVPSALNAMGAQLMKSVELRDTTFSTKYPVANPHVGKFRLEMSRYLGNTAYTGSSLKAWYLLADPADLAAIEVAFLNGMESPTIETAEADFDVLGVRMRGYHDFGVAKQDPKAAVKSKGEA